MEASSFSLKDIDRARYRPTKESEDQLVELRSALGVLDKATMARLAIARSLIEANDAGLKMGRRGLLGSGGDGEAAEKGASIEGVHLFGADTDLWACLVVASIPNSPSDVAEFRGYVEFHWNRGAGILYRDFYACDRNIVNFVVQLAGQLKSGSSGSSERGQKARSIGELVSLASIVSGPVWEVNAGGGNGLFVISGRPGSGKSQVALDLLAQAAAQGVRFLFFDLKGELEASSDNALQQQKRDEFLRKTNADYVRLISGRLPINPLIRGDGDADRAQIASEIAHLVKCFASQLGPNQERVLREAYESLDRPDLSGLLTELERRGEDGVLYSVCQKIDSFEIFSNAAESQPVDEWVARSKVIDFKGLGNDTETKALVVAFVLNSIMRTLNKQLPVENGVQPLQMILFVDEAHLLLPKEGKAGLLGSLARQGRSWGFPVWLASQDANAFVTKGQHATDFSELADCGLHLSPEVLSESAQKHILGQIVSKPLPVGHGVLRIRGRTSIGPLRQFWRDKGALAVAKANAD